MNEISASFGQATQLILSLDPKLFEIIWKSLQVSISSVFIASLIGLPLAGLLAVMNFPLKKLILGLINGLMGFPPVVMGLIVYLLLSRSGPLGVLGLLYTATAMIIAQTLLITPLICAIARQSLFELYQDYQEQLQLFALTPWQRVRLILYEGRTSLITAILAGFGRAIAEVGAVMIVGGNIQHYTRVMTTAIALETSKGELALALGLGIILLSIALIVNFLAGHFQGQYESRQGS